MDNFYGPPQTPIGQTSHKAIREAVKQFTLSVALAGNFTSEGHEDNEELNYALLWVSQAFFEALPSVRKLDTSNTGPNTIVTNTIVELVRATSVRTGMCELATYDMWKAVRSLPVHWSHKVTAYKVWESAKSAADTFHKLTYHV